MGILKNVGPVIYSDQLRHGGADALQRNQERMARLGYSSVPEQL